MKKPKEPKLTYNVIYKHEHGAYQTYTTLAQDEEEAALNFLQWAENEEIIWDFYHIENHFTAWR